MTKSAAAKRSVGRPRLEAAPLVHINTQIFKGQDEAIDAIVAESYGVSRAAVIRELIAKGLAVRQAEKRRR